MKRLITIAIFLCMLPFAMMAQYKFVSCESNFDAAYDIKYVLETENSTLVYGCFTSKKDGLLDFDRGIAVYQGDVKYKSRKSVNIPLYDAAEQLYAYFSAAGEKLNFIIEFEKFSPAEKFDIIEKAGVTEGTFLNMEGITVEPIESESFPDTDKFLDAYLLTTFGRYAEDGTNVAYYLRDNVFVSCRCTTVDDGFLEPKYVRFMLEINNDSDHGIRFDYDATYLEGHRKVGNKQQDKKFVKYTPDSFEQYLAEQDYYEARSAVGGMKDLGSSFRSQSYNSSNSEWANLGLKALGAIADQIAENNIQEYLASHPKHRPSVLKTTSLRSGESVAGYMAFKQQPADTFTLHIPMDDFDFNFLWKK